MKASYFTFWKILVQKNRGWKIEIHFIFKNLTVSYFQIFQTYYAMLTSWTDYIQLTKKDKLSITKKVRNIPFALASFFLVEVRLLKTSSPNHYLEEYLKNHYLKINQQFNNYLWWKHLTVILLTTFALKNTNWYHQSQKVKKVNLS